MKFFAINGTRPIRLSEETRKFAFESLNHKYGKETWAVPAVSLDDIENFEELTNLQKHDAAIERIATAAPIRICEGEKVSGAATLGKAILHEIPAVYHNERIFFSISHLTLDFETVLKHGVNHIMKQAEESLEKYKGKDEEAFVRSCIHCINCMKLWRDRYLDALKDKPEYRANYENLLNVPFEPAKNFYEAVQSLWFTFAFVRLCGNWPGIGRLDWLLGDYLEKDLADGVLTLDEAREIMAHFFIKGCEWIKGGNCETGDAQHYQNILLGGIDADGKDITNHATYLALDVIEELGISDFPTTVRISKNSDEKLIRRLSEVIRLGGGTLAVYNEDLIIDALVDFGYDLREARCFANDGCWEVQIPGRTCFGYLPFDALQVLQERTLKGYDESISFDDFDSLYNAFIDDLKVRVDELIALKSRNLFFNSTMSTDHWVRVPSPPCTVVSLFEQGCIEKGHSYSDLGPDYLVASPHIGGLPDVVNSLYAIKKLVFDEKKVSFGELIKILKNNWEDNDTLRQYALNKYTYYGNDNDEADIIAVNILNSFADFCDATNVLFLTPAGISTFGRQLEWSPHRFATPYGKKAHDILAGNFSPTPGTDKEGATAIIKSYCKANLKRMACGAALDVKLLPSAVNGENGVEALMSLLRGFVTLGGNFMQLDITDTEALKKAQENPEEYQNLSVRVSGWNARFVTLNKEWQDMVINQTGSEM